MSDVDRLLNAGADKISINSSAIRRPELIDEIAKHFGHRSVYLPLMLNRQRKAGGVISMVDV